MILVDHPGVIAWLQDQDGRQTPGEPVTVTDATGEQQEARLDAWLALTGQIAAPDRPVILPLLSGSMVPAIPVGALLDIVVAPDSPCRAGDIAIFRDGERLVAHRVLLVLRTGPWNWLLEKGDANALGRWRRGGEVRGRVVGFAVAGQKPVGDPADPAAASQGLRSHLRQWLKNLVGQRPAEPIG
jgi:hypothetical protein